MYETADKTSIMNSKITVSSGNGPVISEEAYKATAITAAQEITDEIKKLFEKKLPATINSQMFIKGMDAGIHVGGMAADIILSYKEEGAVQATITAGLSTSLTAGLTLYIAGILGTSFATTALIGYLGYQFGKWLDNRYDEGEEAFEIWWDNQFGKAIMETTVSDLSDLRGLIAPFYSSTVDCDLNEIEVRVKPENEGDEPLTYLIKKGDTVWDLCQKYDTTYDELIELNPWLSERFSDDREFCLIRPGETLKIPCKGSGILDVKPTYDTGFKIAGEVKHVVDPMFLDLNKDGVLGTTSVSDGIYFDHEGDGFAESSAWVDKEDGVLVIDKNNDGKIDNGNEVFGDNYVKLNGRKAKNGFEALADLDSNGDGVINALDGEFDKIKVLKGNGELVSLDELGIVSINLNKTEVNKEDGNKNVLVYEGTFVYEDGSTGKLGTFNLGVDKMLSEEVNKVEVSDDVKVLPDVKGYGKVHSLHQAMMLDESGSLKSLVQDFVNTEDIKLKKEILVNILHKWTGADKIRDNSRGEYSNNILNLNEDFNCQMLAA